MWHEVAVVLAVIAFAFIAKYTPLGGVVMLLVNMLEEACRDLEF